MAEGNPIISQIQILNDISALDTAISRVDVFTQSLERLESAANRAFSAFNNMPNINFPEIPDMPEIEPADMPEPPEYPEPPEPPQPPPPEPPEPPQPPEPPEPSPLNWNVQNNQEVFDTSGVERYRQELSALGSEMQSLMNNQTRIDNLADNMDLIPDNMITDIEAVNQRILNLSTSIQNLENESIDDIGANRVNNQIERLRSQLNSARQSQNALNGAIRNMDASRAQREYRQLNSTIDEAERNIRDNIREQERFNNSVREGVNVSNGLAGKLKTAVGAYLTMQAAGKIIDLSDEMAQSTARLNMIVDDGGSVDALKDKIFNVAESSRGDYMQTMDMIGKLGIQAGDAFKDNNELLNFADQLNKQFVIAGTSADGVQAATLQLTQALGSGVLRGEEFNSVFEQAPNIMRTIADYLGKDISEMRELAEDGAITADIVKNALLGAAKETNKTFSQMPKTFSQIWTSVKNKAIKAFEPILEKINQIANSTAFQNFVDGITDAFEEVGAVLSVIFDGIYAISECFSNNWSTVSPIIKAVEIGLVSLAVAFGICEAAALASAAASKAFSMTLLGTPVGWIVLAIAAIVAAITWLTDKLGGFEATWELVKMWWKIGCLDVKLNWEVAVMAITYIIDSLSIAMIWCKNSVLNSWDLMKYGMLQCGVGIVQFIGDMKASVLKIIEDMVNGGIDLINKLIGAINLFGANIKPIDPVTFGTDNTIRNQAADIQNDIYLMNQEAEFKSKISARDAEVKQAKDDRDKHWEESNDKIAKIGKEMEDVYNDGMRAYNAAKVKSVAEPVADASEQANSILAMLDGAKIPDVPEVGDKTKSKPANVDRVGKVDKVGGTVDVSSEDLKRMRDIYENDIIQEVYASNITPQVNIQFGDVRETADVDKILGEIKSKIKESISISPEGLHQGV